MHFTKRRLKKPLYKRILSLKKNIYNNEKFLKFKKQKWQRFQYQTRKNKKRFFYDSTAYVLFSFKNFFSKKFKYNLQNKQRLSYFYGGLSESYLKKLVYLTTKKSKNLNVHPVTLFLEQLEGRLDSLLYRSHFCSSYSTARQLILHKKVYVNKQVVQCCSYKLQKGDLISVDRSVYSFVTQNILNSKLWPIVSKTFHINYKTLEILMIEDIKYMSHLTNYPFLIDFSSFIQFYKK